MLHATGAKLFVQKNLREVFRRSPACIVSFGPLFLAAGV